MELLISLVTVEGQTVLDPFMGSGTTCLAAKNLNRHYIGIDIDPHCVRVAEERLRPPVQTELASGPEAPKLSEKLADWCGILPEGRVVLVTDQAQKGIAEILQAEGLFALEIVNYQEEFSSQLEALKALGPEDLVVAALSLDSFTGLGANRFFSPFSKPQGLAAKYAFLRLDITPESLLQGLCTAPELVYGKIAQMAGYEDGAPLRVQNPAGTDLTLKIHPFSTCSHRIEGPGGMAFLPPSETSAEVVPGFGDGKIVIDLTVGQLYHFGKLLGNFGLVDRPVTLTLAGGVIQDITGGPMARELKEKLFSLPEDCRRLTELGQGLSDLEPTGLIGVDESILHSCHFGFGDGGCGTHLDLVLSSPVIRRQ